MKQRDAVFNTISSLLTVTEGEVVVLTKEQRKEVIDQITAGIQAGDVEFSDEAKAKYATTSAIRSYVSGLVTNWMRKDTRLNGNIKYTPASTGTSKVKGDDTLKAMKILRKQLVASGQTDKVIEVDEAISSYIGTLKAAKKTSKKVAPEIKVDLSAVPSELKDILGI